MPTLGPTRHGYPLLWRAHVVQRLVWQAAILGKRVVSVWRLPWIFLVDTIYNGLPLAPSLWSFENAQAHVLTPDRRLSRLVISVCQNLVFVS